MIIEEINVQMFDITSVNPALFAALIVEFLCEVVKVWGTPRTTLVTDVGLCDSNISKWEFKMRV